MVAKIQPPSQKIGATLGYNENKADGTEGIRAEDEQVFSEEKGHVVATRNVPEGKDIREEFSRLEDVCRRKRVRGRRMENYAFHMSVNPSPAEMPRLGDEEMTKIIDEVMDKLGYGDVPYRIYRHNDTGRPHYHVVSTRIGQDGKKISDSFEHLRLMKVMTEMGARYGFVMGRDEDEDEKEEKTQEKAPEGPSKESKEKRPVPAFDAASKESRSDQYRRIWEESYKWSLTTFEQYRALMRRRFATDVEFSGEKLVFTGLDAPNGEKCTPPVSEAAVETGAGEKLLAKLAATNMKEKRRQRERLENLAFAAAKESKTFKGFLQLMERKGVYCVLSYTEDGKPFGLTWLDRATRCGWKGSETEADLKWLLAIAQNKKWKLAAPAKTKDTKPGKTENDATKTKPSTARTTRRVGRPINPLSQSSRNARPHIVAATSTQGSNVSSSQMKDKLTMSEEERQRLEEQVKI